MPILHAAPNIPATDWGGKNRHQFQVLSAECNSQLYSWRPPIDCNLDLDFAYAGAVVQDAGISRPVVFGSVRRINDNGCEIFSRHSDGDVDSPESICQRNGSRVVASVGHGSVLRRGRLQPWRGLFENTGYWPSFSRSKSQTNRQPNKS